MKLYVIGLTVKRFVLSFRENKFEGNIGIDHILQYVVSLELKRVEVWY